VTSDFHPDLVRLAEELPAVPDVATDSQGREWACERCPEPCGGVIVPAGVDGRLHHLVLEHGWRMDGRRYDNQNRLLEVL
jgi:hypothetical protein